MKKRLLLFIMGIVLTKFVSATYSLSDLFSNSIVLNNINSSTLVLGTILVISFFLFNYIFLKIFKGSVFVAGTISGILSFFLVYWVNKSNINYYEFFDYLGYSDGMLSIIFPLLILILLIIIIKKIGLTKILFISGLGLIGLASFTEMYNPGITIIMGIGLLLFGLWRWKRNKVPSDKPPKKEGFWKKQWGKEREVMGKRRERFGNWNNQRKAREERKLKKTM